LKRALQRNRALKQEKEERFEKEEIQFHRRVRKGYLAIAKKEPHRVKVIDTREGEDSVFDKIRKIVDNLIGVKGCSLPAGRQGFKGPRHND
jgi:dTMP kinase